MFIKFANIDGVVFDDINTQQINDIVTVTGPMYVGQVIIVNGGAAHQIDDGGIIIIDRYSQQDSCQLLIEPLIVTLKYILKRIFINNLPLSMSTDILRDDGVGFVQGEMEKDAVSDITHNLDIYLPRMDSSMFIQAQYQQLFLNLSTITLIDGITPIAVNLFNV